MKKEQLPIAYPCNYDITYEEKLSMLYSSPEYFGNHGGFIDSVCLNNDTWLDRLLEKRRISVDKRTRR